MMVACGVTFEKLERDFSKKVNAFFQKVNAFFQKVVLLFLVGLFLWQKDQMKPTKALVSCLNGR